MNNSLNESSFNKIYTPISGFDNIVIKVHEISIQSTPKLSLLCLSFNEDLPKEKEFISTIFYELINYCIPKPKLLKEQERAKKMGKSTPTLYMELFKEARDSFIAYKNTIANEDNQKNNNIRYAEIGELIAYCIAITYLKAAQLVSKMALKTNSEMPVFGLDGIHASIGENGELTVFYLESKMTRKYEDGIEQYSKSVAGFENSSKNKSNEYRIIKDLSNLDALEGDEREKAKNYFDPYSTESSEVRERFVGILTHSDACYQIKIPIDDEKPIDIHFENFKNNYMKSVEEKANKLAKSFMKNEVTASKCRTFMFAVPDIDLLKEYFAKEMTGEHIR